MPSLSEIEAGIAAALLDPACGVPSFLKGDRSRRFDVYRNNMIVGLLDALAETYPAVRKLVGEAFFRAMAREFARRRPPATPVLSEYGAGFADFVGRFPPAAGVPYLADVARLEWAWLRAYHAADREPLPIAALADLPEAATGAVVPALHPSLRIVRSRWPVVSLWSASIGDASASAVDLARGETALVLRPALEVTVRKLPVAGAAFLRSLSKGSSLAEAASAALETDPGFDLAAGIAGTFEIGAVVGLAAADDRGRT